MRSQIPTEHINLDLAKIDHVSSNVKRSGSSAMSYVFEDNKAVIKMIIKGRSLILRDTWQEPTELLLDWLFDRISLVFKIQI